MLEVFTLGAVKNWRERCRFAACYLAEAWLSELPRYPLELLREFDHIFVGLEGAVGRIAESTGRPCSYLPRGVDTLLFSPYPNPAARGIDVATSAVASGTQPRLLEIALRTGFLFTTREARSARSSISSRDEPERASRALSRG